MTGDVAAAAEAAGAVRANGCRLGAEDDEEEAPVVVVVVVAVPNDPLRSLAIVPVGMFAFEVADPAFRRYPPSAATICCADEESLTLPLLPNASPLNEPAESFLGGAPYPALGSRSSAVPGIPGSGRSMNALAPPPPPPPIPLGETDAIAGLGLRRPINDDDVLDMVERGGDDPGPRAPRASADLETLGSGALKRPPPCCGPGTRPPPPCDEDADDVAAAAGGEDSRRTIIVGGICISLSLSLSLLPVVVVEISRGVTSPLPPPLPPTPDDSSASSLPADDDDAPATDSDPDPDPEASC